MERFMTGGDGLYVRGVASGEKAGSSGLLWFFLDVGVGMLENLGAIGGGRVILCLEEDFFWRCLLV